MVNNEDDCDDCKENEFLVYVYPGEKYTGLDYLLTTKLGFTEYQSKLIIESKQFDQHPIFIGTKKEATKVLDIFVEHNLDCAIKNRRKELLK